MPKAGLLGVEAAIAPPIKTCAVAVTSLSIQYFVNLIQRQQYDSLFQYVSGAFFYWEYSCIFLWDIFSPRIYVWGIFDLEAFKSLGFG